MFEIGQNHWGDTVFLLLVLNNTNFTALAVIV